MYCGREKRCSQWEMDWCSWPARYLGPWWRETPGCCQGPFLGLCSCHIQSLCYSPWFLLPPKDVREPDIWAVTYAYVGVREPYQSGHLDLSGLCFYLGSWWHLAHAVAAVHVWLCGAATSGDCINAHCPSHTGPMWTMCRDRFWSLWAILSWSQLS